MQITYGKFTKDGVQQKTKKLYARFYDHNNVRRTLPLFSDRKNANDAAKAIERLVNARASGGDIPPELQRFIENTLPSIRTKLAEWGIVDSSRIASVNTLDQHITNWERHLRSKGNLDRDVTQKVSRVRKLFKACRFVMWNDIRATVVSEQLAAWRALDASDIGAQTSNHYTQAAKQFCNHMVKMVKCASVSPLSELSAMSVSEDRRHDRRACSVEEFRVLLSYLATAETRWNISASERALIYQFAVETGLRHGGIKRIEVRSFGWHKDTPAVKIAAGARNKYKEVRWVLFTRALWAMVERHIAGKKPGDPAFKVPPRSHAAKLLKRDLGAARAKWLAEAASPEERAVREESDFLRYKDDEGRFLDFHALRHTRGVWLFEHYGAGARQVQELLGVHSIALVDRYSKSLKLSDHSLIERGPDLSLPVKTETPVDSTVDHKRVKSLAHSLAQDSGLNGTLANSGEQQGGSGEDNGAQRENEISLEKTGVLTNLGQSDRIPNPFGEVAEWLNAPVSKTG